MNQRPNILMIMADQLPAACLGTYGHPLVKSPYIDALAARGVVFEQAYCNSPICAPSRASMCTGRYVSEIGAYDNGTDFLSSVPTFMHHLRRAGYEVLLSGKMHFLGPDQMHGFQRRLTPEIYPSGFQWTPDWTRGAYHNPGTAIDQLHDAGLCKWNLQLDYDDEVHFRALEALRELARRTDSQQPFFLCASYTHPHDPFITTQRWWDLYNHDDIELPTVPAVPIDQMHPYNQWLQIHHMVDEYPPAAEHIRNARHAFYGMVSYFDSRVGQLVQELERLDMADNTVILVTADHGEMLGEHGMWFKRTFYDYSVRVPLVVTGSEWVARGQRRNETVSLVDLLPTFNELVDLKDRRDIADALPGDSLCGLLAGDQTDWKDYALTEYLSEGVCQPLRMIVSEGLKLIHVQDVPELLFDLTSDPNESNDCLQNPSYAEQRDRLRAILLDGTADKCANRSWPASSAGGW